jgi:hypothetical protein
MGGLALLSAAFCIIAAGGTQTELMAGRTLQGLASASAVLGTCRGRHQRGAGAQGAGRRLGRLSDARLRHRAAGRRCAHALSGGARDLLAQRPAPVSCRCPSGVRRLGDRACRRKATPARGPTGLFCLPRSWCRWFLGCMHYRTLKRRTAAMLALAAGFDRRQSTLFGNSGKG